MNAVIKTIDEFYCRDKACLVSTCMCCTFMGALPRPLSALRSGFLARAPQELHVGLRGVIFEC
jgi:hypothetical protein